MKRLLAFLVVVVLCVTMLPFGCTSSAKKVTIGLSFAEFEVERWSREKDKITELAKAQGADVVYQVANNDATTQNSQIENMVAQKVDAIIIVAVDGAAAATAVDAAAAAGVPCIAYDRLINSSQLGAYITFDNVEVGRQEAKGVLNVVNKGNFACLWGSPTDNNAHLVKRGILEVLQPLVDNGSIKIVGDQFVDGWSQEIAVTKMESILTKNQSKIDAVVASNDSTGLGALEALSAVGLAGKVPISGQDATLPACQAIAEGKFTVTVFKDINQLAPKAVDIALKLANKQDLGLESRSLADLTGDKNAAGNIPCSFLPVTPVTKDNLYDTIVKPGFQPYDDVYKNVADNMRPPKP
ncbi:MAG: substrate-binding domain-containing protein [Spirochaetales bacterium]|nr:substrate-binding domain-containing protein [Spirochaetales bacterium]